MYNSKDDFHFRTAGENGVIRTLTGMPGDPPPGIQTGSTGRPTRPEEVCRAILSYDIYSRTSLQRRSEQQ